MNCTATFRDLTPLTSTQESGTKPWIHIAPKGEFPGVIDIPAGYDVSGYGVVEENMSVDGLTVIDDQGLESMVRSFKPEMLIDYEHFSHDKDKSTEAAGWGNKLRQSGSDLELETDWSQPAKQQIADQVYRYISPEFAGNVMFEDGTFKFFPHAVTGAGLTNRPKLKVLRPITLNRETNANKNMNYKNALCKSLGLDPAKATDAEIQAACDKDKSEDVAEMARCKNRITVLETENKTLRDSAIDADLERFAPVIEDKDSARSLLQTNREAATKLFTAQLEKHKTTAGGVKEPLYQRNRATPPDGSKFTEADKADEKMEIERNVLVATVKNREKCSFEQAWNTARSEKPELFETPEA